ncbi:MAG: HTH domain-containing protein [Sebaldella sp.]|nr:HTH domain-containing protein [Sebaldella sp.]
MEVFRKNLEKSLTLVFLSIKGKIISVRKMNINNRLLKILDFLESNSITSIKEVTKALNISDRVVRYEIDNLNFILKLNKLPIVKKESKGKLLFDESLKTDETLGIIKNISKHSREERLDFIKLKFLI